MAHSSCASYVQGSHYKSSYDEQADAHKTSDTANKFANEPIPQNKTQCTKNTTMYVGIQIEKKDKFTDMQNC
jgi:hypothetical protein